MIHRPNRVDLYRRVCTNVGIVKPSSQTGYFSRKEMMELLLYTEQKTNTTKQGERELCTREQGQQG